MDTDSIVNATNEGLRAGGGVCEAIFAAAGMKELQDACRRIRHCDTGSAIITPAFDLKARYIIHAVDPMWKNGEHSEPKLLYGAYRSSLELAAEYCCRSIGFPMISAGILGYPVREAWKKALDPCNDFLDRHTDSPLEIVFSVLNDKILETGREMLKAHDAARHKKSREKRTESLIRLWSPTGNTTPFSSICRTSPTFI